MALYPCPECKREISTGAKVCPHCGKRPGVAAQWRGLPKAGRVAIIAGLCFFGLVMCINSQADKHAAKGALAPDAAAQPTAVIPRPRPTPSDAQLDAALAAVKKRDKVLSAAWNNKSLPSMLVGVNGAGKVPGAYDSYARGICGALTAEGINGAFVHVLDNNASGWVELGKAECPE